MHALVRTCVARLKSVSEFFTVCALHGNLDLINCKDWTYHFTLIYYNVHGSEVHGFKMKSKVSLLVNPKTATFT